MSNDPKNEFEQAASDKERGLLRELFDLVKANKKWWLVPILLALGLIGLIVVLGATKAAPFIYTLF